MTDKKTAAERMLGLFAGNRSHYGTHGTPYRDSDGVKWAIKKVAATHTGDTTVAMWQAHLDGKKPLGVVPITDESTCRWGSIDIDDYDVSINDIIERIEKYKLPLVPCRSKSGGLHLFCFVKEFVEAARMQSALRNWAAMIGHAGSEIFPKQTNMKADEHGRGSWIIMPYFGDDYGGKLMLQVGLKLGGAEMTIEEFLMHAERGRVDPSALDVVVAPKISKNDGKKRERPLFSDGPPCLVHLTTRPEGIVQGGQNNTLFHMAVYFKRRFPEDWKQRLEDANQKYCRPPHPADGVAQIIRSHEKTEYQYKCKDQPMQSHCDVLLCRTRKFGVGAGTSYPVITDLRKLKTEPALWFVDVEGVTITMDTEELQNYGKFHRLCMEHTNRVFAMLAPKVWFELLNEVMANVEEIPAPEDVGIGGQFREMLQTFLTNRQRGQSREDLLTDRPWEDEEVGRHYFTLRGFQKFLDREGMRDMNKRGRITARIKKDLKGGHAGQNIKGHFINLWWVPSDAIKAPPVPGSPKIEDHGI